MKEFVNCKGQQGCVRVAQLIAGVQWLVLGCWLAIGGPTLSPAFLQHPDPATGTYFYFVLYTVGADFTLYGKPLILEGATTRGHSVDGRAADER